MTATAMPVEVQRAVDDDRLPACAWFADVVTSTLRWRPDTPVSPEKETEICIRLVSERESRELNNRYRGKDKPTNVLSFPADLDHEQLQFAPLGDVVICASVVGDEASDQGKPYQDHLTHMLVHGVLHLLGYDHESGAAAMQEMELMERKILDRFGFSDPYGEL